MASKKDQTYQPHLRYYLIDEGAYSDEELQQTQSALSGIFNIEKASTSRENLQQAVNRIVAIIKSDPHKERLDRVITRWLKRHLQRLDAAVDSKQLNSLVEDSAMLAENLQHWAEQERMQGREEARQESKKKDQKVALKLIALNSMTDDQIADISGLNLEDIVALRKNNTH